MYCTTTKHYSLVDQHQREPGEPTNPPGRGSNIVVKYGAQIVKSQSVVMQLMCRCHGETHDIRMYKIPKEEAG